MCLRQVMYLSCYLLSQMKNLGTTIELDPKGDKITCPAFGLYSSPAEHSTIGHIVLNLTNLAYQPTSLSSSPLSLLPVWQDPAATLEHEVPKDSRERAEDASILGRKGRR